MRFRINLRDLPASVTGVPPSRPMPMFVLQSDSRSDCRELHRAVGRRSKRMDDSLRGKIALVTGGSSGIGRATALAFARQGARVVVADITRRDGEQTVQMTERAGGSAIFLHTDITQSTQVESMVSETVRAYGRLDFAFNNAGVEGTGELTHLYAEEMWRRVIEIDLIGTWLCMKYELTQMLRQGSG